MQPPLNTRLWIATHLGLHVATKLLHDLGPSLLFLFYDISVDYPPVFLSLLLNLSNQRQIYQVLHLRLKLVIIIARFSHITCSAVPFLWLL